MYRIQLSIIFLIVGKKPNFRGQINVTIYKVLVINAHPDKWQVYNVNNTYCSIENVHGNNVSGDCLPLD